MNDHEGHAEPSRILLAGRDAIIGPSAAIAGLGAAMEAAAISMTHRAECVKTCACGGADDACPGCGNQVRVEHTPDCAANCPVCPVAEAISELVHAFSDRAVLAEPLVVSREDLALLMLCASFGVSMVGEIFCRILEASMKDDDFDWTPVTDHFGTLFEHAKVEEMITAGRMLDGSQITDCADV